MQAHHLVFLFLCISPALTKSLLAVLQENGFTEYARQLEGDPILSAGPELIVYSPTNAALIRNQNDTVARRAPARTNNRAGNSFSCVNAVAPTWRDPYTNQGGNGTSRLFRKQESTSGAVYGTFLDDPEWVNLGPGRNQTLVEKTVTSSSLPIVFSGLGASVSVTASDISFDGGVIRPIDGVLTLPRNLSYTLPFLGADTFGAALEKAGLLSDLDNRATITVLAPDDTAFQNASRLSDTQLAQVLAGHVVLDFPAYTPLLKDGHTYSTLGGGNVTVSVRDGVVYINDAQILAGDAVIKNGVVHTIDKLLTTIPITPVPVAAATTVKPLPWVAFVFTIIGMTVAVGQCSM
ncbi:FAS1 domain-containing protein [Biscogniauxia mediterranea]|nr:FAS1 domain-containing protein [Biscogniauxia mediterranea]